MRILAVPFAAIFILCISNVIAWGSFIWTYHVFTSEEPVLTLRFEGKEGRSYLAIIESPSSLRGEYLLYGDQWRIDARFVKMKYWANLLGADSRYAIDRLQGRYINVNDENERPNVAHQLTDGGESHFTVFGWSPFIDTEYGSSTYQHVDFGRRFTVYKTTTGLMVRSEEIAPADKTNWLKRLWR